MIVLFFLSCDVWRFSLIVWCIFLSRNPSPMSWLYILITCIRVSSYLPFLANSLMSFLYSWSLVFSFDLVSLYPAIHFLSMWLSGIIAIINNNGESAFPWKAPFWIFPSFRLFLPAVDSTLQFFMVFSVNFMTSSDILYSIRQSIIQLCEIISNAFCNPY